MDEVLPQKKHRAAKSGRKSSKKSKNAVGDNVAAAKKQESSSSSRVKPTKATAFKSSIRAAKAVRRAADIFERKTHIPLIDRTPVEPPPIVVAIVGSPKVGKSTLLRCLVKHSTRQSLTDIKGPVTVVAGKKRRVTFLECSSDVSSMVDVAKIADLVLLMIDASYGFEMETFEFLTICQVHGMPRILGVLNHLDMIKNAKTVKRTKKMLKHRFWTEVYQGAKLFYLSGLINDQYLKNEITNLSRFISVMKFRPLQWRSVHPYILADRMEDLTDQDEVRKNAKCDRKVSLYGYVRGAHMKNKSACHIPGVGDLQIEDISILHDPCPLPTEEKRRSLNEKEKVLYAPMSGVGGIVYDKDAVYIDLGGSHSHSKLEKTRRQHPLVESLTKTQSTLDEKLKQSKLRLFAPASGHESQALAYTVNEDNEDNDDLTDQSEGSTGTDENGEEEEDMDDEDEVLSASANRDVSDGFGVAAPSTSSKLSAFETVNKKLNASGFGGITKLANESSRKLNWNKIVYGNEGQHETGASEDAAADDGEEFGGLFKLINVNAAFKRLDDVDCALYTRPRYFGSEGKAKFAGHENIDWSKPEMVAKMESCFAKRKWDDATEGEEGADDDYDGMDGDDDEREDNDESWRDDAEDEGQEERTNKPKRKLGDSNKSEAKDDEARMEKKRKMKQMFDAEYDEESRFYHDTKEEFEAQAKLNKSIFAEEDDQTRLELEGFRPGLYVRVEFSALPCEFVDNFDPRFPYIVGGLLHGESNYGYVQTRLLKHRWHSRILKNRDPLIISMGWRRFQSLAIFSSQDHNGRHRMLKYTPEHLHCHATFWGPITPQNTGCLAISSPRADVKGFRISATGVVLNLDKSFAVVKKLKLSGTPIKVFKKTAFIKDMFNSSLEIAKFEGCALRTVSGLRGVIKKPIKQPEGAFRATFEDKILVRDIVFMRTWFSVEIPKFCITVPTLLLPPDEKLTWQGMKTVGQLRFERGQKPVLNTDSLYKPVVRRPFIPDELKISKKLQKELPYAEKPKLLPRVKSDPVNKFVQKHSVVILEPKESEAIEMLNIMQTVNKARREKEAVAHKAKVEQHRKAMEKIEQARLAKQKSTRNRICKSLTQRQGKNAKSREAATNKD